MLFDIGNPSLLLFGLVPVIWCVQARKNKNKKETISKNSDSDSDSNSNKSASSSTSRKAFEAGVLDIRRKSQIATGRVIDHRHDAILRKNNNLDLDRTIFANVKSPIARYSLQQQLGWDPMWSDASISRIEALYKEVPDYPPIPKGILNFMDEECNFLVEHADGSFMDHLRFLYDFTHRWYKQDAPGHTSAPLVMLLHSITGVGTNFFPMEPSKLPKLQQLLNSSPDVFKHVLAFPSFLRLLKQRAFIRHLQSSPHTSSINSISLHRIIDNQKITFTAQEMWVALNYQLIHALDFLPLTHLGYNDVQHPMGCHHPDSPFLSEYFELYDLLTSKDRLFVNIKPIQLISSNQHEKDMEYYPPQPTANVYSFVKRMLPQQLVSKLVENITCKNIQRFSDQIGHSLEYEFTYV